MVSQFSNTVRFYIKDILIGVFFLFLGFSIFYYVKGNPYKKYQLITEGITTIGFVSHAYEAYDESGEQPILKNVREYNFKTESGKTIKSQVIQTGELPSEFKDLTRPTPIDIVYLKTDPSINKPHDGLIGLGEFFYREVGAGLLFLIIFSLPGIGLIINSQATYLKEQQGKLNGEKRQKAFLPFAFEKIQNPSESHLAPPDQLKFAESIKDLDKNLVELPPLERQKLIDAICDELDKLKIPEPNKESNTSPIN